MKTKSAAELDKILQPGRCPDVPGTSPEGGAWPGNSGVALWPASGCVPGFHQKSSDGVIEESTTLIPSARARSTMETRLS